VQIGSDFYWDGGYMANPSLKPLVEKGADDLLTVLINPLTVKHGPPIFPRQIVNRINEVSFGASWVTEIGRIESFNKLIRKGLIPPGTRSDDGNIYAEKRFHVIAATHFMEEIGAASKSTPSTGLFQALRSAGRETAELWVLENLKHVGKMSTFIVEDEIKPRTQGSATAIQTLKTVNGTTR
jgi:NTE family protein